ncbi:MAG: endonuclease domain-containing protein, partial [Solirubrobacteraceae bacterium]
AATLACGDGAALSHHSSGAHLGMERWEERHPEITVPRSGPRHVNGVRVHRSRGLDRRDVIRHDGIWVTSPARTLLDLAADMPLRALRRMIRRAQVEHRVSVRQVLEVLTRANGHHGATALRAAIADGPAPTRSELEDVVLDLIDAVTSVRPEINAPLLLGGERLVPDFLWRERRVVIEADGRRYHDGPVARAHDARRQAILEAHGYRVLRITWEQAVRHPAQTRARIRAALGITA